MSSQQKFYLSFSLLVLFLGYASFIGMSYKKEQLSQQVTTDVPVLSSGNTSSTGIILSDSGSNQSGSVTQNSTGTTTKFKKPNTEWKSRTLSGITYVFGEGNPKEVALSQDDIFELNQKSCTEIEKLDSPTDIGFCDPNTGYKYVTREVEQYILSALSDPNWAKLMEECESQFRFVDRYITPEQLQVISQDPYQNKSFMYYDKVFSPGFLDIDNFILIDSNTGLKKLNTILTTGISNFLMQAMLDGQSEADGSQNPYGDCVDRYAKDIVRNLITADNLYSQPLVSIK